MRIRNTPLALLLAATLLAGCGLVDKPPVRAAASSDVPAAPAFDPVRSQALYLDVIRKLHDDGKSHAALAYLDDFDRRYPADPKARLLRADCLLDVDRLAEAEALYQGLVPGPEQASAASGLGHVAAARGDWAGAVAAYERATSADPVNAAYRNDLGYALMKTRAFGRAIFALRQASELDPGNLLIRNNLNLALAGVGERRK